jgi:hypothetical protein
MALGPIADLLTRTGRPTRIFTRERNRQYSRKPARCHPTTVSGFTMMSGSVHLTQTRRSMTQKNRSPEVSRGRGWRRDRTVSCYRSARFSSARSLRKRQTARSQRSMRASRSSMVPVVTRTVYSGLFRLPTPRFSRTWWDCGERQVALYFRYSTSLASIRRFE